MLTTEHYERVKKFMQKAGQDTPEGVTIPDEATRRLRAKLILEEALETIEALGFETRDTAGKLVSYGEASLHDVFPPNLVEIADGCADLKVVTTGTLIAFGIKDGELQEAVDRANLQKFEPPKCPECGDIMYQSNPNLGWMCPYGEHILPLEAGPYRRDDGKWIKPPDWQPPDIESIIKAQTP